MARLSREVCRTSGVRPSSFSSSPPLRASSSPAAERSTSTQPVNSPFEFQTLSPCRSSTRVPIRTSLAIRLCLFGLGRHEMGERTQFPGVVSTRGTSLPFLAYRRGDTAFHGCVEVLVGVSEHAAEKSVDLLRGDR